MLNFIALDLEKVYPGNCKEIYDAGQNTSGLYRISPVAGYEFTVFCDMNLRGGGWTVISRRVNNSISFNRNWTAYRNGFGEFNSNFWLGLQKIKDITEYNGATNELYIGMQGYHPSSTDRVAFSIYKSFTLKDESAMYALDISSYDSQESTAGDALKDHTDKAFATPDNDNANNCASRLCAGWWYIHCADSHLTGKWYASGYITNTSGEQDGIIWDTWTVQHESLNAVVMAIRPV